jgi:hypothetical protein
MRSMILLSLLCAAACGDNDKGKDLDLDDVSVSTNEDTPVGVTVPLTASQPNKVTLTVETPPMHGTVSGNGPMWTYTPAENYNGPDTFVVKATKNTKSVTAHVTINVTPVNDPPVANADNLAGAFDTPSTIPPSMLLTNDTDVEGQTLTLASVAAGTHGTVALTGGNVVFTPEAGFAGAATFTYQVSDGFAMATGNVTVTIGDDTAPVAVDDIAMTDEDVVLDLPDADVLANDTDAENQTLAVTAVATTANTHGTVTHAGTTITYTPDANFHGTATFEYTVSDGFKTDVGLVTVTVSSINDHPVAGADTATTPEDTALALTTTVLLSNDTDPDGDTLTVTAVQNTANTHGVVSVTGTTVTYTPAANYFGPADFTYTVSDGNGGNELGTVNITVTPVQDAPVAVNDAKMTAEDTALVFPASDLSSNDTDADGDTLTVTAVNNTASTNGTVALAGGNVTYTPAANFNGAASFTYTVDDGHGNTATGTVNVTVTPVDDPAVAVDDTATVAEATANNVINVLANDTDVDSGTNTVASVTQPAHGTAAIGGGGANVTYTPAASYCNEHPNDPPDSFTYTLSPGNSTATVRVTVTCKCGIGKATVFVVGSN